MSAGYEKRDVDVKKSVIIAASIVLFIVISLIFVNEFFLIEKEDMVYQQQLAVPSITLEELRAHEDTVLTSYGVLDKETGVYRIPLSRAMELVASEAMEKK